jgi:hypothetical protein
MIPVVVHIILLTFVTITLLVFGLLWVIDLLNKATTLREYAPWLVNLAEHKKWHGVVYLMCWVFLCADGWDLFRKEIPEVPKPPVVEIRAPLPPKILNSEPQVITRTLPAPPSEKKCWFATQGFNFPDPSVKESKNISKVIMHCNYRVEAPFLAQVEFDRDFILGEMHIANAGTMTTAGGFKRDNVFGLKFNSPSLLPDQLFIVTVYGKTEGPVPFAIKGSIEPSQP